jgi:hypothetical protein
MQVAEGILLQINRESGSDRVLFFKNNRLREEVVDDLVKLLFCQKI